MFTIALIIYGVLTLAIVLGLCFAAGRPTPSVDTGLATPKARVQMDSPKVRARGARKTLTKRFAYGA